MKKPTTMSLFCGGGGETMGKVLAFEELGLQTKDTVAYALNHWDDAVQTHRQNFPGIECKQESIEQVTAADFGLAGQTINMLWASPSCVHFSTARGGKPVNDQQRSHADEVVERFLKVADVKVLLMENVPEFRTWGPLHQTHKKGCSAKRKKCRKGCHFNKPIEERKGEFFAVFIGKLETLGYAVEYRIICAANHGDPTVRKRFYLQAVKDGVPIRWPEASHRDPKAPVGLFEQSLPPWRTAAECIDFTLPCPSIFDRKKPLAANTLKRIAAGIERFVLSGNPFLVEIDGETQVVEAAFIAKNYTGVVGAGVDTPMPTVTARDHNALVAATLVQTGYGERPGQAPRALDIQAPLGTVMATGTKHALVHALLASKGDAAPVKGLEPSLAAASLIGIDQQASRSVWAADAPLTTLTTKARHAVVCAAITKFNEHSVGQGLDEPLQTLTAGGKKFGLVAAFLQRYGKGDSDGYTYSLEDPLLTQTTKDRFALVTVMIQGQEFVIQDIGLRMLQPRELARAMGLPDTFTFLDESGNELSKEKQVKMIGNMCPVNTVKALVRTIVEDRREVFTKVAA